MFIVSFSETSSKPHTRKVDVGALGGFSMPSISSHMVIRDVRELVDCGQQVALGCVLAYWYNSWHPNEVGTIPHDNTSTFRSKVKFMCIQLDCLIHPFICSFFL